MSSTEATPSLPKYVYLYFLCQSLNATSAVISVTVAATVGLLIAPNESWATLPYGMQFLCMLLATYPVSVLMTKKGRKFGFVMGALGLASAGVVGYHAVIESSFISLVLAHSLLGVSMACTNYYRFAAVDNLVGKTKTRAVSLVIAGGLVSAVLGPYIGSTFREVDGFPLFALCYMALVALAAINILIIALLPKEVMNKSVNGAGSKKTHSSPNWLTNVSPLFFVAVLSGALGFGLMNLVMIQSSLQMHHLHVHFDHSAMAIQWHVVAMFAPSFLSGFLVGKLGHQKVIFTGLALFMVTFLINLFADGYTAILVSLITLGLAWNFTYISGSAYISVVLEGNESAKKLQGVGETGIALFAMAGAMTPALLISSIGWKGTNLLCMCLVMLCILVQLFLISLNKRQVMKAA